jgi:hypothetical protein
VVAGGGPQMQTGERAEGGGRAVGPRGRRTRGGSGEADPRKK